MSTEDVKVMTQEDLDALWAKLKGWFVKGLSSATDGAAVAFDGTSGKLIKPLGYTPFNAANFTKANIKSTLEISDWALAASKPSYAFSEITGTVTNAQLAGSIANDKLANSSVSIAGTSVSLGGSITAATLKTNLSLGASAYVGYDTEVTQNSTKLITSGAVYNAIDNLPEPMIMKGTLGTNGTITSLPTASASNEGFTYKVITAGTYASQAAKVGDVFVSCKPVGASAYEWMLIPAGDTDSDTWRNIKVNGTQLLGTAISSGAVNFKNGGNITVTGSGNDITLGVASGYAIPTTAKQGNWDTAYGWGNHANAGYALAADSSVSKSGETLTVKINGTTQSLTNTNTHRPIQLNGTEILGNNTTALNLKAGTGVSLTNSSGTVTVDNSGVRAATINGNYLRINTNGTNADLTIPYATKASQDNDGKAFKGNYLRKVTVANNTTNDFNTFESMTMTGRGDPTTGASLVNAPWTGGGPAGGYGTLTYIWGGYGIQMAWGCYNNHIYIRNKHYNGSTPVWSDSWSTVALTSDNVASATKLQTERTIWGQSFNGSANVTGAMTDVTTINGVVSFTNKGSSNPVLNIDTVSTTTDYISMYVTATNRPLVLQMNAGNVGIGVEQPTTKLDVAGGIKGTSVYSASDYSRAFMICHPTGTSFNVRGAITYLRSTIPSDCATPTNRGDGVYITASATSDYSNIVLTALSGIYLDGTVRINGNTAWHAGNDGANSGLDADLLDGTHKADLFSALSSDATNAVSVTIGGTTKNVSAGTMRTSLGIQSNAFTLNPTYNIIYGNNANTHYWKIAGTTTTASSTSHNAYIITTRNGESYYVTCGTTDGNASTPFVKRLTRNASGTKILEFRFLGRDLYLKTQQYENRVLIRQIGGTTQALTITEITEATFNEATLLTVDVVLDSSNVPKLGSTTKPVYLYAAGTFAECSTYAGGTKVTFNGSDKGASTASFYAPTGAGTSGQILKSTAGTPEWINQSAITAGALTTVSKTAWGQTYWTSGGVPTNISGDMSSVGNIAFQASGKNIGGTMYFDTTNHRVGINDSAPSCAFDVTGDIQASGGVAAGGILNLAYNGAGTQGTLTQIQINGRALTDSSGIVNIPLANTTSTGDGAMSHTDKLKLDGIATGATNVTTDTVAGWGYVKDATGIANALGYIAARENKKSRLVTGTDYRFQSGDNDCINIWIVSEANVNLYLPYDWDYQTPLRLIIANAYSGTVTVKYKATSDTQKIYSQSDSISLSVGRAALVEMIQFYNNSVGGELTFVTSTSYLQRSIT